MNGGSEKEYIRANPEQRKKEQGLWASVPLGRDSWCRGPVGVREQHGLKVREEDSAPGW